MERLERIKTNARLYWVDDVDSVIERVDWLQEGDFRWLVSKIEEQQKEIDKLKDALETVESAYWDR